MKRFSIMIIFIFISLFFSPFIVKSETDVLITQSMSEDDISEELILNNQEYDKDIGKEEALENHRDSDSFEEYQLQDEKKSDLDEELLLERSERSISTLSKSTTPSVLKEGIKHPSVIDLKKKLNKLKFGGIKETDYFGSFTTKRVKEFQGYYKLTSDGVVGNATNKKINEVYNSPYQKGKRHNKNIEFKKQLNSLGYGPIKVTNLYGSFMEKQVIQFQKDTGLKEHGIIDSMTQEKLSSVTNITSLKEGTRSKEVVELKKKLNKLRFGNIKETEYYGSFTTKKVREYQRYYGLKVSGNVDDKTMAHIDETIESPYQKGKRNDKVKAFKYQLNNLGYGPIKVTSLYGEYMEKQVIKFQNKEGLKHHGIIDRRTEEMLEALSPTLLKEGMRHQAIIPLKQKLNKLEFGQIKETNLYGSFTTKKVKEFQGYYGLKPDGVSGLSTLITLDSIIKESYQVGDRHKEITDLKRKLNKLGYGPIKVTNLYGSYMRTEIIKFQKNEGLKPHGLADYKTIDSIKKKYSQITLNKEKNIQENYPVKFITALNKQMSQLQQTDKYRNNPAYVSANSKYIDSKGRVKTNLNVRADTTTNSHIYGQVKKGSNVSIISKQGNWYEINYSTWRNPTQSDVEYYLNPNNNDKFQHLALDKTLNVLAVEMNKVLTGKGTLENQAQAFINAGKMHQVNEAYLISHAILETGHGKSKLAQGVEVGEDKAGNLVLVTTSNRKNLSNIKTTYNMFGIGAVDSNALAGGAIRAYQEDWTTPKKAIEGGAKFIGSRYIHNQYNQNTLYKMRWNPANPGYPQYATDIAWATKQVGNIKNIYQEMNNAHKTFYLINYR